MFFRGKSSPASEKAPGFEQQVIFYVYDALMSFFVSSSGRATPGFKILHKYLFFKFTYKTMQNPLSVFIKKIQILNKCLHYPVFCFAVIRFFSS